MDSRLTDNHRQRKPTKHGYFSRNYGTTPLSNYRQAGPDIRTTNPPPDIAPGNNPPPETADLESSDAPTAPGFTPGFVPGFDITGQWITMSPRHAVWPGLQPTDKKRRDTP